MIYNWNECWGQSDCGKKDVEWGRSGVKEGGRVKGMQTCTKGFMSVVRIPVVDLLCAQSTSDKKVKIVNNGVGSPYPSRSVVHNAVGSEP